MSKYTIETLSPLNHRFEAAHYKINQSDVDMANKLVAIIESSRTNGQPQPGDALELYDKHGDYYGSAHIDRKSAYVDDAWDVCERAYCPYVSPNDNETNIVCDTSGGAWPQIPNSLTLIGKRKKRFWRFGHCGACGDGGIEFEAEVNVWEYRAPDAKYGKYTTKDYDKMYISYRSQDEDGNPTHESGYVYFGSHDGTSSMAWKNKTDYLIWLRTVKGVELEGNYENQTVVFYYKTNIQRITKDEWWAMDLPIDTRMSNGSIVMRKFEYDDEKHLLIEYTYGGQCKNGGYSAYYCADLELDWRTNKPYRYQRELLEGEERRRHD